MVLERRIIMKKETEKEFIMRMALKSQLAMHNLKLGLYGDPDDPEAMFGKELEEGFRLISQLTTELSKKAGLCE